MALFAKRQLDRTIIIELRVIEHELVIAHGNVVHLDRTALDISLGIAIR